MAYGFSGLPVKRSILGRGDETLVCGSCGSTNVVMAGKHGFIKCRDCDDEGHATNREDYEPSESQQGFYTDTRWIRRAITQQTD